MGAGGCVKGAGVLVSKRLRVHLGAGGCVKGAGMFKDKNLCGSWWLCAGSWQLCEQTKNRV